MWRSQIYIRYEDGKRKGLIAKSYKDVTSQGMVSRAKWIVSFLIQTNFRNVGCLSDELLAFLSRFTDVDLDGLNAEEGSDIIRERIEYYPESDFNKYVFYEQDNQGGKLLLDIRDGIIAYAFLDWRANANHVMDAEAYMRWRRGNGWKPAKDAVDDELVCENNVSYLKENAVLMSKYDVSEYLTYKYDNEFNGF